LATYFPELNLQPPFVVPGVVDGLVGKPKLVFMLGAKPRPEERRNDISHWDALSLADLFARCSKLASHKCEIDIQYVLWHSPAGQKAIAEEPWAAVLSDDDTSVVSIGSPLVALSTEVMLARMFNVEPFTVPCYRTTKPVPFSYVWRPQSVQDFVSAFSLPVASLQALDSKFAKLVQKNQSAAFVLDDKINKVPMNGNAWTMHGVIAAQRRAAGNVWLVVSGLAGPATCAAAQMVKEIMDELPWSRGQASQVLWVPVTAEIKEGKSSPGDGDVRKIISASFDGKSRVWPE
jgi:hypothetical protein